MKKPISKMNTATDTTAQAGQLVSLAACREQKLSGESFSDNLDYLEALEQEGKLILAQALLRQRCPDWNSNPDYVRAISIAGLSPEESKPEKVVEVISAIEQQNRLKAATAEQNGVSIYFIKFCREKKLEGFNRITLLLLLLLATSERFAEMFDLCNLGDAVRKNNEVKIGAILNIISRDLREQLANRQCFSVDSPLIKQDILHIERRGDDNSNIFERYVSIHDRYVRYLVGDNNLYKSMSEMIQRDTSSVRLDQVIVPEETKKELVSHIGNYLAYRNTNEANRLDDFYGYGTALTILFHGPSGTGKTMMAQALASHFNRPLYSLKANQHKLEHALFDAEAIENLFLEASLNSGIVFFDEADDLFAKDTYSAHLLLIQIEKARCVVILSTNKPVDLDPAMDRRLSLKIHFGIPEVELRYKIWQALMPDFIKLAPDIDIKLLADRYHFTGGLIKNSIFMALNSSLMTGNNGNSVVTMGMIKQAAELQLRQMVDMSKLYQIYSPAGNIRDLAIKHEQKIELSNVAKVYKRLKEKNLGINILITCSGGCWRTGIKAVEALANACNLKIKEFDYATLYRRIDSDNKVFDPITQNKMCRMEYAFTGNTGDSSLLLIVDYFSNAKWTIDEKQYRDDWDHRLMHHELVREMADYKGIFCMVTDPPLQEIPVEFNLHLNLEYPPEEVQMRQWEKYLQKNKISDDDLVSMVENNPMHFTEIDFIAKQAMIQSTIKSSSGGLTIKDIISVIARYRPKHSAPLLFGRQKEV
ncbi:MAG: ATP-binding protein [Deltaproteobacteria bacterium]